MSETPPPKPPRKTKYNHPKPYYVEAYGLSLESVRRYFSEDWPMDDPLALLQLILAQAGPKKPDLTKLREVAGEVRAAQALPVDVSAFTPAPPPETAADPIGPPAQGLGPNGAGDSLEGLQLEIHRLKLETDIAYRRFKETKGAEEKALEFAVWSSLQSQWVKLAKAAPEAEREAGLMARLSDVRAVWEQTFTDIKAAMLSFKSRLSENPLFAGLNRVEVELAIEAETVAVMTLMSKGGFKEAEELEE